MQASDTEIKKTNTENIEESSKKSNVKYWIEIAVFLACVLAFSLIMSYVMDPVRLGLTEYIAFNDKYVCAAKAEKEPIDVLVVGDSEALVLLSPQKMLDDEGISSFIAGQSGMRVSEAYYAIKDIVKTQDPKVVLLETDMLTMDSSELAEARMTFQAEVQEKLPVTKYHGMWKEELGIKRTPQEYHYHGFEPRDLIEPYDGGPYMFETEDRYKLYKSTNFYLNKIYELCEQEGITIVLVSSTSPMNFNYTKHNAMVDLAESRDTEYLDLNMISEEIGIDWATDELDGGDHVNLTGTIKQTDYIEKYLSENFDLPDRRGED